MIRSILYTAVAAGLSLQVSAQESIPVTSKVRSATVYLNNAELHNAAAVSLKPGTNYLLFKNLSPFMDANSIRVGADKEITITGVNLKTNYVDDADMPAGFKELDTKLKEAELNLTIRKAYKSVYIEEKDLMLKNKTIMGGDSKLTPEDLNDLANIYRNRLKEIEIKIIEITQEENKLTKEVEKLTAQMGDRANNMVNNRSEVEVTVVSKFGGNVNFDLSYLVYNAGWAPTYEIRTDDNSSNVKLIYKANVFQSTAIDWTDAKLTLSTGNPSASGAQPVLGADYVDYMQNRPRPMYKSVQDDKKMEIQASAPAEAMMEGERAMAVTVSQGNVSVYFDIPLPYSIPSTNRPTAVEIQSYDLTAEMQYLAIPKLNRDVYLLASIKGWETLNLLPGQANIYFKNSFIGQSYIDPSANPDKLEVALGNDNGVIVERKDVNQFSKDAGLISGNKKEFHYKITVKNTKQKAINIRVEDQVPVSRNNDIMVENGNLSGGILNAETGVVTWNLSLQAGEQRELELKYTIKFPKGSRIDH